MKNLEKIKKDCEKLVDVVAGPMNVEQINNELKNVMNHRSPEYLVIVMEKRKEGKYQTTIYLTKEDCLKYK